MARLRCAFVALAMGGALATSAAPARADFTFKSLANFELTNGSEPGGTIIEDTSGNLFGVTGNWPSATMGSIYELPAGSSTISTLAAFNGGNGSEPSNLDVDNNGNFFGTTYAGGSSGGGTVFKLPAGSSTISPIVSFTGPNGSGPRDQSFITDSAGDIFGTTYKGGSGYGTVFELPAGSNQISPIATFNNSNGSGPLAMAMDKSGNIFGVTQYGGQYGIGTVFEVPAGTHTISTILSFGSDPDLGQFPTDLILDSNGNLYGSTNIGGPNIDGSVFKLAAGTYAPTLLASFGGYSIPNLGYPDHLLLDPAGDLFGTSLLGGQYVEGSIWEVPAGTQTLITLHSFDSGDGADPDALSLGAHGNLFGATEWGGDTSLNNGTGEGTLFELSPVVPEPASVALLVASVAVGLWRGSWPRNSDATSNGSATKSPRSRRSRRTT
ncbi:MAG TPA: choice-of-anchor tandem repeat GloVer-containing protein [Tepidisphaeraceae bacterium]|nr:choice-of-anchor tandem repeat GloVer-containing protein [Tepidisphaeraceae bacterium]